jgi:NADH-quinone oxidoreductase subunit G
MPHIYLDGQKIEAQAGKTIIQAAYDNGIDIPHFCWHPELSVAGNCRMCLVEVGMPKRDREGNTVYDSNGKPEIGYLPKLQIACSTPISDGMVVHSKNQKATEAQEAVMEFLLINHPLDCPICDEAGECKLQEYAFRHSKGESRFEEVKNHKDKRQKWGPNVMYDAERCISCSRCIRFAKEVAGQDVLTFVQRGDHVTIKLFDDTVFDSPYSMNVIEICPVGALTSPDFRFKSRVWDMSFNDSITPHDSTGANIKVGVRNNQILRIEPRTNMYVNKHWLTDEQRKDYKFVNENRITEPLLKISGKLDVVDWESLIAYAAEKLSKFKPEEIMVLASPRVTNEAAYLIKKFAKEALKTNNVDYLNHVVKTHKADGFLLVRDKSPNTKGCDTIELSNSKGISAKDLKTAIETGRIKALYLIEEDFKYNADIIEVLGELDLLIVQHYNNNKITEMADIVLPASTFAEIEGTYTNKDGRVQHFTPFLVTKENRRYMGMKMSRLDKFGAFNDRWTQHETRNSRQSWRIVQGIANSLGTNWSFKTSEDVFEEIANNIGDFKHMTIRKVR